MFPILNYILLDISGYLTFLFSILVALLTLRMRRLTCPRCQPLYKGKHLLSWMLATFLFSITSVQFHHVNIERRCWTMGPWCQSLLTGNILGLLFTHNIEATCLFRHLSFNFTMLTPRDMIFGYFTFLDPYCLVNCLEELQVLACAACNATNRCTMVALRNAHHH
jgi:hypothetical protein